MTNLSNARVVLASASPRRRQLLASYNLVCEPLAPDVDETVLPQEAPQRYVHRLALAKARQGWRLRGQALNVPCLGSDTTVVIDGAILEKPLDHEDARRMLRRLSGRCHTVHTAVACVQADRAKSLVVSTQVYFANLSDAEIERYCLTGEPMDKAGAYGIQGLAAAFVKRIEGSYSAVVGLPLYETRELLAGFGVELL